MGFHSEKLTVTKTHVKEITIICKFSDEEIIIT